MLAPLIMSPYIFILATVLYMQVQRRAAGCNAQMIVNMITG